VCERGCLCKAVGMCEVGVTEKAPVTNQARGTGP
jgi:hypothetical protein